VLGWTVIAAQGALVVAAIGIWMTGQGTIWRMLNAATIAFFMIRLGQYLIRVAVSVLLIASHDPCRSDLDYAKYDQQAENRNDWHPLSVVCQRW
jgi:hypothetical protein